MKSEMILRREGGSLHPADDASWEVMDRIAAGSTVVVRVSKGRYPEHLAKYWVLCRFVADFDPEFDDQHDVDNWLRLSVPWMREEYKLSGDRVVVKLRSISMDEMDQVEFDRYYTRCVELLSQRMGKDVELALAEARPLPKVGSFDR